MRLLLYVNGGHREIRLAKQRRNFGVPPKWIFMKYDVEVCNAFNCPVTESSGGFL